MSPDNSFTHAKNPKYITIIKSLDLKKSFYIVKPKATCHITRQASINACASVRYPI